MKTNDWIDMLAHPAAQPPAVSPMVDRGWLLMGGVVSLLMCAVLLGVNEQWPQWLTMWAYEFKAGFAVVVLLLAVWAWRRLLKPGQHASVVGLLLLLWGLVLGAAWWMPAQTSPFNDVWQGTWRSCSISIVLLALPVWLALWRVVKQHAPVHLRLTGAAMGAVAGGAGALIYSLHCTEFAPMFVAVWYGVGMAVCAVISALVAPRLLRW